MLVPISRMYLGVHTPWDVLAAASIAVMLLILLEPFFDDEERFSKAMPIILGIVAALELGFFLYAVVFSGGSSDANVLSAGKNARTFLGCVLAIIPVYFLKRRFVKFETKAKLYSQIIKLAFGLGFVILIKEGLRAPLAAWLGEANERILRYFIIVLFAGLIWPLTFRWFSSLEIPVLDRFGAFVLRVLHIKQAEPQAEGGDGEAPRKVNPAEIKEERKSRGFLWFKKKEEEPKRRRSKKKKKSKKRR